MSDTPASTPAPAAPSGEDKTVAIVAYLTLIGFIVAIVIHSNKKTRLGAYHLRQCLGFVIAGFAIGIIGIVPILGWIAAPIIALGLLVFWIMGLVSAINGQMKPVPLVGEMFQKWFGTAFD